MALASTTVWEVRTTGSDTNGGGFNSAASGTDYSQQDSAQIAFTDLVIGSTTTQLTSAGNPFTSAHVGNIINITSGTGFTVQRVQISSVASNVATCDKSCGTASSTGGVGNLGGCLASPGQASALKVAGNDIYVKSGTYTFSTSSNASGGRITESAGGGIWAGYGSTRGDKGTKPIFRAGANSVILFTYNSNSTWIDNIEFKRDTGLGFTSIRGIDNAGWQLITIKRCKFNQLDNLAWNIGGSTICEWMDCEISACSDSGNRPVFLSGTTNRVIRCVAHGATGSNKGFYSGSHNTVFLDCISYSNGGDGFDISSGGTCLNCTSYSNSGNGFTLAASGLSTLTNCISYGNTTSQISIGSGSFPTASIINCAVSSTNSFSNATNGRFEGTITLTADPFNNAASQDFSLNTTAGGGGLLRAAGLPQTLPGISTNSYIDVGASQHPDPGGGPTYFSY